MEVMDGVRGCGVLNQYLWFQVTAFFAAMNSFHFESNKVASNSCVHDFFFLLESDKNKCHAG